MPAPLDPQPSPPRLPGIRRLLIVGISALLMVALAIAVSLFELRHDREVQHQYENTLAITRLTFDAESLASRIRALEELRAQTGANAAQAGGVLQNAVRSLGIDATEWEQRIADAMGRDLPVEAKMQLSQLRTAIRAMRAALDSRKGVPGSADLAQPGKASPSEPGADTDSDRAYLAAVEAAQAALLSSVRASADRSVLAGYTISEVSTAIVVVASLLALLLGAVLAALVNRAQHESRATIGVMGELLRTDPLTGIANRRCLDENLPIEMARAKRTGTSLTAAMLDLDYFKRYNSRRGHAGGDSLLRTASQSWRSQLRPTDTLVRYGGEEFTLVLPSCDAAQACQLIDRLRPVVPDSQTFSAGVATWDFQESGADLLRRADQALLLAKKYGRNRTIVSGREDQISLPLSSG